MRKYILFFFISSPLASQETIQLDRPDQTETVAVVPKNYLQAEAGFLFEKVNANENATFQPSVLWKYGVNNTFEIRFTTTFLQKEEKINLQPLSIGFKTFLLEEKGIIPKISFIGETEIVQNEITGRKNTIPSFRFTLQNTLSQSTSLGYNLGMEWDSKFQETYIYTLTLSQSITKRLNGYIEVYGFINALKKADHRMDGGITYLINKDFMLDVSSGMGLSEISLQSYFALGISYRMKIAH